ncbi:hypothetical protein [Enterococcus faecalis]|uniref:hypothetical protein n=2 Tax=cellular organisms TaxID=131567 RepID=UPI003F48F3D4
MKDRDLYILALYVVMLFIVGYLIFDSILIGVILGIGSGGIMGYIMSKKPPKKQNKASKFKYSC